MSWIQTFTGRRFRPRNPAPDDFDIRDVAHALSLLCRFNGHCRVFYSVAEHSVRVSRICPPPAALWGLLHDLGEAYIGAKEPIEVERARGRTHRAPPTSGAGEWMCRASRIASRTPSY